MVCPSQTKIAPRASPWQVGAAADKARFRTTLSVDLLLVGGAWRLFLYVCICCQQRLRALHMYPPDSVCRIVTKSKCSTGL